MKSIKRIFSLLLILVIAALVYAQYRDIPLFDISALAQSLKMDANSLFSGQEVADGAALMAESDDLADTEATPTKKRPESPIIMGWSIDFFTELDQYVRSTPASAETDVATLAAYLSEEALTDLEKARAIYVWLTDNVVYDDDGFNSGNYSKTSAEEFSKVYQPKVPGPLKLGVKRAGTEQFEIVLAYDVQSSLQ